MSQPSSDPAHFAESFLRATLPPHFVSHLPPYLGYQLYQRLHDGLVVEGLTDQRHAITVFCRSLNQAADLLRSGGGAAIHAPERWLLDIARKQLFAYLQECSERDSFTLHGLLEGELALSAASPLDEEKVSALVLRAIDTLSPKHREFLLLDLMKKLPEEEIRELLDIPDRGLFRALKAESVAALRTALQALIKKGIDTLF